MDLDPIDKKILRAVQMNCTLGADELGPGSRELAWDGGADGGASLPTGVYVLRFEWYSKSEGRHQVRRAVGLVRP